MAIRLLIDLPNWVGDSVMALPAVARCLEAEAGEGMLLCRPPLTRLLQSIFPAATIQVLGAKAPPVPAARLIRRGLGGRAEIALSFRNSIRSRAMLMLSARRNYRPRPDGHQVADLDSGLVELGLAPADPSWCPPLQPALVDEGRAALGTLELSHCVGLAPASAWGPSKRWGLQKWSELCDLLIASGRHPVIVIGPGEEEFASRIAAQTKADPTVLGPGIDIAGLFGLLSLMPIMVSNDSGPMHLAAAAGCRVVALFGPTDQGRTAPLGAGHQILDRHLDCAPCLQPICPLGHQACLEEITATEVMAALGATEV